MTYLIGIIAGIYGAIFGSFTTALIHRLHFDKPGFMTGRSQCPDCKNTLRPKDLVPMLSWVVQNGKCRYCTKSISITYPLIELIFMATFALFAIKFWNTPEFIPVMLTTLFCLILFFYDTLYQEVDLRIVIPAIILAFGWSFFRELPWTVYLLAGGLGFSFYAVQFILSKGKWVGDGDMFLGAFMGLVLGLKLGFIGFFMAYIIGCIVAIYLVIFKKANRKTAVPMGAFLMPAMLIMLYTENLIWDWYWSIITL